jgi:hypothetical protein
VVPKTGSLIAPNKLNLGFLEDTESSIIENVFNAKVSIPSEFRISSSDNADSPTGFCFLLHETVVPTNNKRVKKVAERIIPFRH